MVKDKKAEKTNSWVNSSIIPWIVFLFSISIVLISFVSVIFPALILASDTIKIPGIESVIPDPYEMGVWSGGVIISNIIVFSLTFLYFKNKLPNLLLILFKKLFAFELSKKQTLIILLALLIIYTSASVGELAVEEKTEDYQTVKDRLESWSLGQITNFEPHVKYFFLKSSMILFENYKIVPFLASIALLLTTYLLTKKITQKRFAGIISVVILMQSGIFLTYDTSVAYDNFWILFYLLSLYLVYKFWPLSPVSYVLSIFSKALTAVFLPMHIYFILRSNISKKQKIITAGITVAIIAMGGMAATGIQSGGETSKEEFNAKEFQMGFTSFSYQLRSDGLVLLFMIPLVSGLFILSKRGIKHAESIMVLISGMLLIVPILTGFTNQTNQPYRFIPIIVFFAIGVGVLLSKKSKIQV